MLKIGVAGKGNDKHLQGIQPQTGCSRRLIRLYPSLSLHNNLTTTMDTSSTPFTTSTKSPQIVSDLWFSDGNLILETENSLFKVYSGLLVRKSSVFRDMFTFPQPNDHKDVPTVRLYDSTEELTWFLKAILDPEYVLPV